MRKNLEIKVSIRNLGEARRLAKEFCKGKKHVAFKQKQEDIYYKVKEGRLKLRIIDGIKGNLIHYYRGNRERKRVSEYTIAETDTPHALENILNSLYKKLVTVKKEREIFIADNIRIHVDTVKGLGKFLEFEVIIKTISKARKDMEKLVEYFELDEKQFIKVSYSDLLLRKGGVNAG